MNTIEDTSYGVIPLFNTNGAWDVFLINQISHRGDMYWTFPKGHQEGDETPEQTALREVHEETGIAVSILDIHKTYLQEYSFADGNTLINKKAIYYVGAAHTRASLLQQKEVKEAGWFSFPEAYEKLTHARAVEMLKCIARDLEKMPPIASV